MRITDLLPKKAIDLHVTASGKTDAIDKIVNLMMKTGCIQDKEIYQKAVIAREAEGSTGIGEGVAIPHAKTSAVDKPALAAMVVPDGVDYDALDGQPTSLFFLIAAPNTEDNVHLDVLGKLSVLLMDDNFRADLLHAKTPEEFISVIDKAENAKDEEEAAEQQALQQTANQPQSYYRVLGVTACPTGIAHTYMAAEALENTAKEMGISIKVETDGSGGVKNKLTAEEIKQAECIIVAADKNVEMARFDGKRVIQTKVANGINKAKELLTEAASGTAPVYHADRKAAAQTDFSGEKEGVWHTVYKHLMNGVSNMLPFVIGGGILIALAFLFDTILAPGADPANFGKNSAPAYFLKTVGDAAFSFMLPILSGFIAMSIGDRPALMVGFVGGYLANAGDSKSGFLGALIAGFVAGYLVVGLRKLFDRLPKSLEGIKPILLYPVIGLLLIGAIVLYIINPPVSMLNTAINNGLAHLGTGSGLVLGAIVGGMMSIDMGGPFNKAAYVFGTASLVSASGAAVSSPVMAAVMAGGMIPPLAIALCTTFFKNRFTKKERQSGLTNYIMGLSFITEGVIPFAAADPLRVIPSCVAGSAVAGALSMLFGCALPAPHGGIFVIPVVENWPMYLLSILIGSVVSMFLLALLKKPIREEK